MIRIVALASLVGGCGELQGFSGEAPPLTTVHYQVTGDFESVRVPEAVDASLDVALVWGAQWLPEPLCFTPPESSEAAALIAAGCRDPLGFVPDRASESVALDAGELSLYALPSADVMVGDVTGRIAYGALVVYDDRNATGRLELGRARRVPSPDDMPPADDPLARDIVYGASFVSMTEPDTRLALREGSYNELAAFYPRRGCGAPPAGFSVVTAGGFSALDAIAATLAGEVPSQDPATCSELSTDEAIVSVPFRAASEVSEVGCTGRRADSSVRYREPPVDPLDLTNRVTACVHVPDFGAGTTAGIVQFVVSSRSDERCKGLTHYLLRGCEEDATCALPEWDITATPPAWWPCPIEAP
ncbi:MAG TPA: hypothetical protein VIV40_35840 [Kofleriaceae bacterium]